VEFTAFIATFPTAETGAITKDPKLFFGVLAERVFILLGETIDSDR
jgi:hypothetical protein